MDVSIIIINYNTFGLTCDCIKSLQKETAGINYEIIVVDNNSNENEALRLEKEFPLITVIRSSKNLGFGKANNLGVAKANGKYVFLLNSDTIVMGNVVKDFFDYMENNTEVGIACGNLINKDKQPMYSYIKKYNIYLNEVRRYIDIINRKVFHKENHYNFSDKVIEVDIVSGADLFIERELYLRNEGFDKNFFMYYEDTDLCLRIKKQKKIVNLPYINIIHLEGASSKNNLKKYEMIMDSKYYFYQKHIPNYVFIHFVVQQFITFLQLPFKKFIFKKNKINYNSYKMRKKYV